MIGAACLIRKREEAVANVKLPRRDVRARKLPGTLYYLWDQ